MLLLLLLLFFLKFFPSTLRRWRLDRTIGCYDSCRALISVAGELASLPRFSLGLQIHPGRICCTNLIKLLTPKIETPVGYYLLTSFMCISSFLVAFFLQDLSIVRVPAGRNSANSEIRYFLLLGPRDPQPRVTFSLGCFM